ncbi:MAG: hypothetical protein AAF481_12760 [Acidobacteriota bacterium]
MIRSATIFLTLFALLACGPKPPTDDEPSSPEASAAMAEISEDYVRLVLAVGRHDDNFVDAYYGPAEWRQEAEAGEPVPLEDLSARADALQERLSAVPAGDATGDAAAQGDLFGLRLSFFRAQLRAVSSRIAMLNGADFTFDEESRRLYDAVAPHHPEGHYEALLASLAGELPGDGPLTERYTAWQEQFVIPPNKVSAVFDAAIAECRRRTAERLELPESESFTVEYVTDQPWSAYNWYQGDYNSLIQVNTDLPIAIDRAVDLACHEGYPGHHVFNVLIERDLVRDRGFQELSVYPLFSPQSLIAEGTANFGIEVAFPGEERTAFERDVLYPLAGLDPARAEEYSRVRTLMADLAYAGNEAARQYLNGEIDADQAAAWLERYALSSRPRAEQRVRFYDRYRSYVINYNLGQDIVRRWVEAQGGTADNPEARWAAFEALLNTPRIASGLAVDGD